MSQVDFISHNYSDVMTIINDYYSTLQAISADIKSAASCLSFSSYIKFPTSLEVLQSIGNDYDSLSNSIKNSIEGYGSLENNVENYVEKQLDLDPTFSETSPTNIEKVTPDLKTEESKDISTVSTSEVLETPFPFLNEENNNPITEEIDNEQILAIGKGPLNPKLFEDENSKLKEAYNHVEELRTEGFTEEDITRILNSTKSYEEACEDMQDEIFQEYLNGDDTRFRKLMEAKAFQLSQYNREDLEKTKAQLSEEEVKTATMVRTLEEELDLYNDVIEHSTFDEDESLYHYKLKSKIMKFDSLEDFNDFTSKNKELIEYAGFDENNKEYIVKIKPQSIEMTTESFEEVKNTRDYYESLQNNYLESISKIKESEESLEQYLNNTEGRSDFNYKNNEELNKAIEDKKAEIGELVSPLLDNRFSENLRSLVYLMGSKNLTYEEVCNLSVGYIDLETGKILYHENEIVSNGTQTGEFKSTGPGLEDDNNPNHYNLTFKDVYGTNEELQEFLGFFKEKELEDGSIVHVLSNKSMKNPRYSEILYNKEEKEQGTVNKDKLLELVKEEIVLDYSKDSIESYVEESLKYAKYNMQPDFEEKSKINKAKLVDLTTSTEYLGINDDSKIDYRKSDAYKGAVLSRVLNDDASIMAVMGGNYLGITDLETGKLQSTFIGSPGIVDTLVNYQKWFSEDAIKEKYKDKIKIFNYICETEGYDKGYEFLKSLSNELDQAYVAIQTEKDYKKASDQSLAPWLRVYSWLYSPFKSLQNLNTTINRKVAGEELYLTGLYNSADAWNQKISTDIRSTLGDTLGDLADITNSMGQSATNTLLTTLLGGTPIAAIVSSFTVMGSTVFNNTLYQAKEKGLDDDKALILASLYALTETGMESYSVSHLLNLDSYLDKALTNGSLVSKVASLTNSIGNEHARNIATKILSTGFCLLSQGAIEGEEEWSTEVLDNLWDYLFSGKQSNYATIYDNYKVLHPGCSDAEASLATIKEIGNQANRAGVSGLVSGMLFGVVGGSGGNSINLQNDINLNAMENLERLKGTQNLSDRISDIWDKGKLAFTDVKDKLNEGIPTMWSSLFDSIKQIKEDTNTQTAEWEDVETFHNVIMPDNSENSINVTQTIDTVKNFMESYSELSDTIVERVQKELESVYGENSINSSLVTLEDFVAAITVDELVELSRDETRKKMARIDQFLRENGQLSFANIDNMQSVQQDTIIEKLKALKITELAKNGEFDQIDKLLNGFTLAASSITATVALTNVLNYCETYQDAAFTKDVFFKLYDYLVENNVMTSQESIDTLVSVMNGINFIRGFDTSTININGKTITVHSQKNQRANSQSGIDIEQIEERLNSLPKALQLYLPQDIYLYDSFNPEDLTFTFDEVYGKDESRFTSAMTADYVNNRISIYSDANDLDSIIHEIAHLMDNANNSPSLTIEWKKAMEQDLQESNKKSWSEYGETVETEDFSESVKAYFTDSEAFREEFKHRAAYLDNLFEQLDNMQEEVSEQEVLNLPSGEEVLHLTSGEEVLHLTSGDEVLKLYPGEDNSSNNTNDTNTDTQTKTHKLSDYRVIINKIFFPFLNGEESSEQIHIENTVVNFMNFLEENYPKVYSDIMGEYGEIKNYGSIINSMELETLRQLMEIETNQNENFVWDKYKDSSIRELFVHDDGSYITYEEVKQYLEEQGLYTPQTVVSDFCELVATKLAINGDYESIAKYKLLPDFELKSINNTEITDDEFFDTILSENSINNSYSIIKLLSAMEKYNTLYKTEDVYFALYDELVNNYGYNQSAAIFVITDAMKAAIQERGFDQSTIDIDGKKIEIYTQKDMRRGTPSITIEDLAKTLDSLPESMKEFIPEKITIYDTFDRDNLSNTHNEVINPDGGRFRATMAANYAIKSMEIYGIATDTDDIIHEMAHLMDINHRFSNSTEWKTAIEEDLKVSGKKSRTSYGETIESEDFAESLKYYFKEKDEFTKTFPNRAAYIENLLEKYEGLTKEEKLMLSSGELIRLNSGEEILRLPAGDDILHLPSGDEVLHLPSGEDTLTREEIVKGYLEEPLTEQEIETIQKINNYYNKYRSSELHLYSNDEESKKKMLRLLNSDQIENINNVLKNLIDKAIKNNDIDFIKDINTALSEQQKTNLSIYLESIYPGYDAVYKKISNNTLDVDSIKKEYTEKSMSELAKELHTAYLNDENSFNDKLGDIAYLVLSNSEEKIKAMALLEAIPYIDSSNKTSSSSDDILELTPVSTATQTTTKQNTIDIDKYTNKLRELLTEEDDSKIFHVIQSELSDSFNTSYSFIKEQLNNYIKNARVHIEIDESDAVTMDNQENDWTEDFIEFYQRYPEQLMLFKYAVSFVRNTIDNYNVNPDTLLSLVEDLNDLSQEDYNSALKLLSLPDMEEVTQQQAEKFILHPEIFMDPDYDYIKMIYGNNIYKEDGSYYSFYDDYDNEELLDSKLVKLHADNLRYLEGINPDLMDEYAQNILKHTVKEDILLKINSLNSVSDSLKKKMMMKYANIEEEDVEAPPSTISEIVEELNNSSDKSDSIICDILDRYNDQRKNEMAAVYMVMNENEELMSFLKSMFDEKSNKTIYNELLELNPELAHKYLCLNIEDDVLKAINGHSKDIQKASSGSYYMDFSNSTQVYFPGLEDLPEDVVTKSMNKIIEAVKKQPSILDYITQIGNTYESAFQRQSSIRYMLENTEEFLQSLEVMNELNDINPKYVNIYIKDYYHSSNYPDRTNIEIFKDPNFEIIYEMFGSQISKENGEYKYFSPSRWNPDIDWYEKPSNQVTVSADTINQHIENYKLLEEMSLEASIKYLEALKTTDDLASLGETYSKILYSNKIDNNQKIILLSNLDKINNNYLTPLLNRLDNAEDNNSQEYFDKVINLVLDIASFKDSNSSELSNFADLIGERIWESKDPFDMVKKIKEIFEKNELPTIAKIYKVFELRDGDWKKIQDLSSPILNESGNLRRKTIILNDLIKTFMGSNNRSIKSYLDNLEFGSNIFEKIKDDSLDYDGLTDEEKSDLITFRNHLSAMYNNTLKGKYDSLIGNTGDIISDIKELALRLSPNNTLDYNIGDRLVSMFMGTAGINTVEQARNYMQQAIEEAEARNIETSKKPLTIKNGDFVRGIGNIDYLEIILQNGSLCQEFLGFGAGGDMTPFDIDLKIVKDGMGIFSIDFFNTMADGYGPIYMILKNDSRYQTTRSDNVRTDENYDPSKYEVFNTLNYTQMGIRTGIASTDIDAFVMMNYDPKVGLEIAKNGFYIPVADTTGEIVFTYENYLELREKLSGLSRYGSDKYEISSNLDSERVETILNIKNDDIKETKAKEDFIVNKISNALKESEVAQFQKIYRGFSSDMSNSTAELYSTGSTSRNTNVPNDSDFDYVLKIDNKIYSDKVKLNNFMKEMEEKLGLENINGRLDGKIMDDDGNELDVQISIVPRTDRVEFSTDVALSEKLKAIKEQYPEQYEKVLANIVLAKEIMKEAKAYKSAKSRTGEGGLGGIGIENWILQNGGSLHDAAEDFLRVADSCQDFNEFRQKYHVFDFGENHYSDKGNFYSHDDFVGDYGKMTEDGYERMKEALREYLANEVLLETPTITSTLDGNKKWNNYTPEELDKTFKKVEKDGVTYYIADGEEFKFLVHVIDTNGTIKPNGSTQEQLEKIKYLQRNLADHPELFMESGSDSNYVLSCSTISNQGMQTYSYALMKDNGQVILGFNEDDINNVFAYSYSDGGIDRDQRPTETSESVSKIFEDNLPRTSAGEYDEVDIRRKAPSFIISQFSPEDTVHNANNIKWAQEYGIPIIYINKEAYAKIYQQQIDQLLDKMNRGECLNKEEDLTLRSLIASSSALTQNTPYTGLNLLRMYLETYQNNPTEENANTLYDLDNGETVVSAIISERQNHRSDKFPEYKPNGASDIYITHHNLDTKYPFLSKQEMAEIIWNSTLKGQNANSGANYDLFAQDVEHFAELLEPLSRGECITNDDYTSIQKIYNELRNNKIISDSRYNELNNSLYDRQVSAFTANQTQENANKLFSIQGGTLIYDSYVRSALNGDKTSSIYDAIILKFDLQDKYPNLSKEQIIDILVDAASIPRDGPNYQFSFNFELKYLEEQAKNTKIDREAMIKNMLEKHPDMEEYNDGRLLFIETKELEEIKNSEKIKVNNKTISVELLNKILTDEYFFDYASKFISGDSYLFMVAGVDDVYLEDTLRCDKFNIIEGIEQLIESGKMTLTPEMQQRLNTLKEYVSYDHYVEQLGETIETNIDNKDYSVSTAQILSFMNLPTEEFSMICSDSTITEINGIPKECFAYAALEMLRKGRPMENYIFPENIKKNFDLLDSSILLDVEYLNDFLHQEEDFDYYNKIKLDENLKEAIYSGMPQDATPLEKAIYVYIKMCKLFTYNQEYYAVNQRGEAANKHNSIDYVSTINLENNEVVCFEFNVIYAKLLDELGINFRTDEMVYGYGHNFLKFRAGKALVNADSVTSILEGDIMQAKLNQPLRGLSCYNVNDATKQEFDKAMQKMYNLIAEQEKSTYPVGRQETIEELLDNYSATTENIKEVSVSEKLSILIDKVNSTGMVGIDAYSYLLQLRRILFSDEQKKNNFSYTIIRNNVPFNETNTAMASAIFVVNEEGFEQNPNKSIYYYYNPNHELEIISRDELQRRFSDGTYEYVEKDHKVPGIN